MVFAGSAQFAAVGVLADGGSVVAAILAGALLNLRSLPFGVVLAPALRGPVWWRALASQLVIDESTAVAVSADDLALRRYGYLTAGVSVFVAWNLATATGVLLSGSAGGLVREWGLDAAVPAAFLALLWPRLAHSAERRAVVVGVAAAALLVPFAPPGLPVIGAGLGALAGLRQREQA